MNSEHEVDFSDFKSVDVRIFPYEQPGETAGIIAYAELTIDNALIIRGFKIIRSRSGGVFIGYPSVKTPGKGYRDIIIPTSKIVAGKLRRIILEAYKRFLDAAKTDMSEREEIIDETSRQ